MTLFSVWPNDRVEIACTIDVAHTAECLHAHVELAPDIEIQPGDTVTIQGSTIEIAYGETKLLHRRAIITRATWLKRTWTRMISRLNLTDLYEVSFSSGRRL